MKSRIRWPAALLAAFLTASWSTVTAGVDEGADETRQEVVPAVPGWHAMIDDLEGLPSRLLAQLPPSMRDDPLIRQEVARLALQAFTASAITALGGYGDHPVFLPTIGELLNVGQPNADTLYRVAQVTPGGVYRLRGRPGSLTMAVIGQVGPATADPAERRQHLEIGALPVDENGYFDVLLSVDRPGDYRGEWWPLHPDTHSLMLRLVSSDWPEEQEPTVAIERLDVAAEKPRATAAELEQRWPRLTRSTATLANMFIDRVDEMRQKNGVNRLGVMDESASGGGLLNGQFYYEGVYELAEDEALILEAEHPASCAYRSILLTSELYQTIDWYNNHSSLNQAQAEPDSDGVLRVVVSARDPGVPNWLDTAGHLRGVIQGRWTGCDTQPVPSVTKVAVTEVRAHLPPDTPRVSAEERQRIVRERRAAYQQRRHW